MDNTRDPSPLEGTSVLRRLRHLHRDDRGTSLMELVVGMTVMGVFMAIFTGAVVSMAKTTTTVEAVTTSSAEVNNAFLRLDKLVRYATAVTAAGKSTGPSGNWYVELDCVDGVVDAVDGCLVEGVDDPAVETCTQLRVDLATMKLQKRTWAVPSPTTYASLSGWTTLASNVVNATVPDGPVEPFSVPAALAVASTSFQQLTVTLVTKSSGPSSTSSTRSTVTFSALNSSALDSTGSARCQQLPASEYRP